MSNKKIFQSIVGKLLPRADAVNEENAPSYSFSPEHALAQLAATGCLNKTFYATESDQLDKTLELAREVDPTFIAKTAVYSREKGYMKDMPALLCAVLSVRDRELLPVVFDRVIDNGKMLRNFVQIMRSGAVGRKSLGTLPKRLVLRWMENQSDDALFRAAIGNDPSFGDIIKMVHPRPSSPQREALYGYLTGREFVSENLPELVRQYEARKSGASTLIPNVPFQLLTSLPLTKSDWVEIARNAPWQMTRMNLNTFARHGVFEDSDAARIIAERLRDPSAIQKARVFPYQLMVAYQTTDKAVPGFVRDALQDAMEIAIMNIPRTIGPVYVFPDISGSMHSPVTGYRQGSTTAVKCVDVAALVAAAILRTNSEAEVIPFESKALEIRLNPRDSVMTNAAKLSSLPCGGTNCSAPLRLLNDRKAKGDLVIYVSDNESWIDSPDYGRFGGGATETLKQWAVFKKRNPNARMICIDIQPYTTTQASERDDILNIGGFSDSVFEIAAEFASGQLNPDHWVGEIEKVDLSCCNRSDC